MLVLGLLALAAGASVPASVQAQGQGAIDLSVALEPLDGGLRGSQRLDVYIQNTGELDAYDVEVVITVLPEKYPFETDSTAPIGTLHYGPANVITWRIPVLESDKSYITFLSNDNLPGTGEAPDMLHFTATIREKIADREPDITLKDNDAEAWQRINAHDRSNHVYSRPGGYFISAEVDDPFPEPGDPVTFSIRAEAGEFQGGELSMGSDDFQVHIELTDGLTYQSHTVTTDGTHPYVPTPTYNSDTGWWDIGYFPQRLIRNHLLTLNIIVDSDKMVNEQCLTATLTAVPPEVTGFGDDNYAKICLGMPPTDRKVLLTKGQTDLVALYRCVGITAGPCDSDDTLEMVALGGTATQAAGADYRAFRPENVVVQISDPGGRQSGVANPVWRSGSTWTGDNTAGLIPGVVASMREPVTPNYKAHTSAISGVDTLPGSMKIIIADYTPVTILDVDNMPSGGPLDLTATGSSPDAITNILFVFGALGTYVTDITLGSTDKKGTTATADDVTYTDTGRYTFHVGPVAELEVRDAGANPELSTDQQAYTITAVNNGPDAAPAVRVTSLPTGVTEYVASEGSYDSASGVWTIGDLKHKGVRLAAGRSEGPTLTLITDAATPPDITAAIANNQDYTLCIDSDGDDVDAASEAACTATSGNTWHTVKYYDHITGNNTATIMARAGTGVGHPDAPTNLRVVETPVANIVQWEAVAEVNGFPVTHYQVQRSASPWETLSDNPKGTVFADMGDGAANASYRVRAVNRLDVPGPWSQQATPHLKPGRPKSFTAAGQSDTQAGLSWSAPDPVAGVTVSGYDLEFSKDGGATWTSLAPPATLGQSATSYTHTDAALTAASLTPVILRQYRARTVGTIDSSTVKSDWATATLAHPKPGVPKTFAAAGQSETQASLSWRAPAAVTHVSVTGYELDISTDGGTSWATVTGTPTLVGTTWSLPHSDPGLAADAVRQYRARTLGTVGSVPVQSDWAYALATEDYPAPGAPRNFAARAINQSQVNLSWSVPETVSGVAHTGYHLEFSSDGNTWTRLADDQSRTVLPATATSHPHVNNALAAGSLRQYRLRAVGTANNAVFESGWVFASAATEAVGPPLDLSATAHGSGRIDLTWDKPGFGASLVTGYRIDYTPASPEEWQTVEHGYRADANPSRYEHTGLSPGQEYCYRVASVYARGTGPFSTQACAATDAVPTDLPGQPENLRVTQVGSDYVTLEWDPPSVGGAVEYYQWRSNSHDPAEVSPRTATRVRVGSLAPSQTYDFQVRAGNSAHGRGQWSEPVRSRLNEAGGAVVASPTELELEVAKGGTGRFNVRLKRSPEWPLQVYFHSDGPSCLTESLSYQQAKILLPSNPPPGMAFSNDDWKGFWNDDWWGPPDDRHAAPWNGGHDIELDASGCEDSATAVVNYDLVSLPFSYLDGIPLWEELGLDQEKWEADWGIDPLDGISGPSVKVTVTVEDGAVFRRAPAGEQGLARANTGGTALNVSVTLPPPAAVRRREERGLYGSQLAWDWWD